jgi:hypothetical protein
MPPRFADVAAANGGTADELAEFNAHLVGMIAVVEAFTG